MIRLATIKHTCLDCLKESHPFLNKEVLETVRDLEDLGWTLVENGPDHFLRCPECTAKIDELQQRTMGPFS